MPVLVLDLDMLISYWISAYDEFFRIIYNFYKPFFNVYAEKNCRSIEKMILKICGKMCRVIGSALM